MQDAGQFVELGTLAHIDDERRTAKFAGLYSQFGEFRDELNWQVVDAVITQILEGLQHRGLPRPAHARNDDQLWGMFDVAGLFVSTLCVLPNAARWLSGRHDMD